MSESPVTPIPGPKPQPTGPRKPEKPQPAEVSSEVWFIATGRKYGELP